VPIFSAPRQVGNNRCWCTAGSAGIAPGLRRDLLHGL
jgi:hypothetical protein